MVTAETLKTKHGNRIFMQRMPKDASGINEPERWLWELIGGVYYPATFLIKKV
jgi:hypothetical protein